MRENEIIITYGSDASVMTEALLKAIGIEEIGRASCRERV